MPRNQNAPSGADVLGLTADDGVTDVPQGQSKFDNVVIDFTKLPTILIPDNTDVRCQIKVPPRPGITKKGFPKVDLVIAVIEGDYEGEVFFDSLIFMPPQPPSKGTMWRVHQFCDSIKYSLPEGGITGAEIMAFLKQFCEDILGEQFDATLKIQYSTELDPKTNEVYKPRNTVKSFNPQGNKSLDDLIFS